MPHAVAFRVDASLQIGSGHVMRCLTLATALREQGASCHFICREHQGNLIDQIRCMGFAATALAKGGLDLLPTAQDGESLPSHASWLGTSWQADARETQAALQSLSPAWLVVDHYALDRRWELALRPHCVRLMVIDDLADRSHECDLLLDQNLGREDEDYIDLVPATCAILAGARYALVRPEFAALRPYSSQRRERPQLRRLLITMGGVDQPNATGQVLEALRQCPLRLDCGITIVMGLHAPWLAQVQAQAANFSRPCEVKVDIRDMAQLMADSDLAIGAAGGTSWERCVLGLPTLMVVLAENQQKIAAALEEAHAAVRIHLSAPDTITKHLTLLMQHPKLLLRMSTSAAKVTDGCGLQSVIGALRRGEAS